MLEFSGGELNQNRGRRPLLLIVLQDDKQSDFFTEYGEASRYQIQEVVGKGSYGVVGSAIDSQTGERVAIKKINDVFEHVSDAIRILREIKLLRMLHHPNIVEIKHIMLPPSQREFKDIYLVFELMKSDLHHVIKANNDLSPKQHKYFLYQLLSGLKYIHAGLCCNSLYTPAIDIWSIGCIFAEILTGKPLFPGKNVVHQLDLITDLFGTPEAEAIAKIRNEKARRYLGNMRKKPPVPFSRKFPNVDPSALRLLERLLAFDPKCRPTAAEALSDPYFNGIAKTELEPSIQPISKIEFEFERRRLSKDDIRELIYAEILEYHPQMREECLHPEDQTTFLYPSGVDRFRLQFAHLEEHHVNGERRLPLQRQNISLPRERVSPTENNNDAHDIDFQRGEDKSAHLFKSASISASRCVGVLPKEKSEAEETSSEVKNEGVDGLSQKIAVLQT
ncbi:Mitogen-activated protein kinase 17, partial [Cucurbita argyrosperma subsp. argyrosperma]